MEWLKKNKDWLITLAVFTVFGLLGLIWSIFFRADPTENHVEIVKKKVIFTVPETQQTGSDQSKTEENADTPNSSTFYLEPGPEEILEKLENMNHQEFKKESAKLPGLKVMWPVYFFSIRKMENSVAEVLFDVSKDGFGALILTRIDTMKYPETMQLQPGRKIWLAGEITGVDPSGTGQFVLSTEYIQFDEQQPPVTPQPGEETQKTVE
jgi:hypothetical protein